jgi:hypothetical protein
MVALPADFEFESQRPRVVTDPRITTPAIVILLGSTPALASLETMRLMLTLSPRDRRKVAFVYIDTDVVPPDLVSFRNEHDGMFQEYRLRIGVPAGISNATRVDQGTHGVHRGHQEQYTFIRGKVPQYFANGAGGIRNNGHVAAAFHYDNIIGKLKQAIAGVTAVGTDQGAQRATEVYIHIVAFLGGGTGSGILPDIAVTMRELMLQESDLQHRLHLYCILPEQIQGVDPVDLNWRRSNSAASLLEVLGLSLAPNQESTREYSKFMREHRESVRTVIANEVYLIGRSGVNQADGTARIVGLTLFQHITDASGVGFAEHSKGVDRRTLGDSDEFNLPTIFGTICPFGVIFPAEATALAFAQISSAQLLPLMGSYRSHPHAPTDEQKREWRRKWEQVARADDSFRSNPRVARSVPLFSSDAFEDVARGQLDALWIRLQRNESEYEASAKKACEFVREEELARINASTLAQGSGIDQLLRHYRQLEAEYKLVLDLLANSERARVPNRPVDEESALLRDPPPILGSIGAVNRAIMQRRASATCEAYNGHIRMFTTATRRQVVSDLLQSLLARVSEAIAATERWADLAGVKDAARALELQGTSSMAWQGRLDRPHPHQRHIFDLHTLNIQGGGNYATQKLYRWATARDGKQANDQSPLDYTKFVAECQAFVNRQDVAAGDDPSSGVGNLLEVGPAMIASRVVEFFRQFYLRQFQDVNLFELLDRATPNASGGTQQERISGYLFEHLSHINDLRRALVAFEPELSPTGAARILTSAYLGMHWRDGGQQAMLNTASREMNVTAATSSDPHQLHVAYGYHAFSLNMVRDYYLSYGSAMADYQRYQDVWDRNENLPVHASGEMERLVTDPDALPYRDSSGQEIRVPLHRRVMRA